MSITISFACRSILPCFVYHSDKLAICCSKAVHTVSNLSKYGVTFSLRKSSSICVHGFKCVDGEVLPFCNCEDSGYFFNDVNLMTSKASRVPAFWENHMERQTRCIHQRAMLAVYVEFFGPVCARRFPKLAAPIPEYQLQKGKQFEVSIWSCLL